MNKWEILFACECVEFVGVFKEMTSEISKDSCVIHAMKMREAWSLGNYRCFFQLYTTTPNFGRHLIDLFIERERKSALKTITKAYVDKFLLVVVRG